MLTSAVLCQFYSAAWKSRVEISWNKATLHSDLSGWWGRARSWWWWFPKHDIVGFCFVFFLPYCKTLCSNKNPCVTVKNCPVCLNTNIVPSFCSLGNDSPLWGEGRFCLHYNSISWASSSEKSDIELSEEESPPPSSCSFRASSVAYFWMYSGRDEQRNESKLTSTAASRLSDTEKPRALQAGEHYAAAQSQKLCLAKTFVQNFLLLCFGPFWCQNFTNKTLNKTHLEFYQQMLHHLCGKAT